jgi:hypothetical protein
MRYRRSLTTTNIEDIRPATDAPNAPTIILKERYGSAMIAHGVNWDKVRIIGASLSCSLFATHTVASIRHRLLPHRQS